MNITLGKITACFPTFLVAAALLFSAAPAKATTLVSWNFGNTEGSFTDLTEAQIDASLSPSTVASGVGASLMDLDTYNPDWVGFYPAFPGSSSGGMMFRTRQWDNATQNYLEFSVFATTPNTTLTITEVNFYNAASAGTDFWDWRLFSNLDGYTTPLASGPINLSNTTLVLQTANITLVDQESVTFRIQKTGYPGQVAIWNFDDISIVGSVIPEPRAVLLLGAGLVFIVLRRLHSDRQVRS